jgi:acyl CoA:acetate/3-ketoacid CoA transferase beta subunit
MAVFEWDAQRTMILKEIAHDTTVEEVRDKTEADFEVAADLKTFGFDSSS